jgi:hypothetical protein
MNSLAVDSSLYFATQQDFNDNIQHKQIVLPALGIASLPFDIMIHKPVGDNDITYNAYQYFKFEISAIDSLIKKAFEKSIVWKVPDLISFI